MKNKKTVVSLGVLSVVAVAGTVGAIPFIKGVVNPSQADNHYQMLFSSTSNILESSGTVSSGSSIAKTQNGNDITFQYSNISHTDGNWQKIAQGGYILNTAGINGIDGLNITFVNSGASIELQYGWNSLDPATAVTLNADENNKITYSFPNVEERYPSLIKITAVDAEQTIATMGIGFTCNKSEVVTETEFAEKYEFEEDENGNIIITKYIGSETNVIVPSGIFDGTTMKRIISIGEYAFMPDDESMIESIVIGSGIETIGDGVFYNCALLTSLNIPNSVTTIGSQCFGSCTSLESLTIGSGVTTIGDYIFYGCSSLSSIVVNKENATYDSRDNCNAIIETATNTLITGCSNSIIPSGVVVIYDYAFIYCESLTSVTIPETVTTIGSYAFCSCVSLASIMIPDSVTSIGESSFSSCESLESVSIGSGISSIPEDAFSGCSSLESVVIGSGVESIGDGAFGGCSSLSSIVVDENNATFDSRDNCNAIIKTATNTLIFGCGNSTIPSGVTKIGDHAFEDCESLTSVIIPSGVTIIDGGAFLNCASLTSVTISSTVTSLGGSAFGSCTSLATINYSGTKAQWKSINKGLGWHLGVPATVVHCTDGDTTSLD